jgi:hypothetical protein
MVYYADTYEWEQGKVELEISKDNVVTITIEEGNIRAAQGVGPMKVTINLSPVQFKSLNALFKRASFRLED